MLIKFPQESKDTLADRLAVAGAGNDVFGMHEIEILRATMTRRLFKPNMSIFLFRFIFIAQLKTASSTWHALIALVRDRVTVHKESYKRSAKNID